MGLGVHGGGLGVARWLIRQGAHVTITDMATAEALAEPLAALRQTASAYGAQVGYTLGEHRAEDFTSHAVVVVNPAVRPDSPWLTLAEKAGARIETEMTLFFRNFSGPILGITGTKGKTTTTLLTGAILRRQYPDTVVAGNLRVSALEALEQISPTTPVVLELSSFQLVGLSRAGLSPQYACITNFSPDHLDYHGTLAAYAEAKRQIYRWQSGGGMVVLNEALRTANDSLPDPDIWFALPPSSTLRTFSARPDSTADCRVTRDGRIEYGGEQVCDVNDIQLPGDHNLANVLAAAALARSFGVNAVHIRQAVRSFTGVEHRLELVRELDGVRYVNDTTATNPAAAQVALASFEAPIVLLAGGADKQLDFAALADTIVRRVKVVVLLAGSATERLAQAIRARLHEEATRQAHGSARHDAVSPHRLVTVVGPYDDFTAAIRTAQNLAAPGDVVLLSPGCASFGMFRNEFHRGEEFRRVVTHELFPRDV